MQSNKPASISVLPEIRIVVLNFLNTFDNFDTVFPPLFVIQQKWVYRKMSLQFCCGTALYNCICSCDDEYEIIKKAVFLKSRIGQITNNIFPCKKSCRNVGRYVIPKF